MEQFIKYTILTVFLVACQKDELNSGSRMNADEELQKAIAPLANTNDLDQLIDEIGDSRFVLLGEASHGTSEYYTWRAEITRKLIEEKGFTIIAVEGDWPVLRDYNAYIQGASEHASAKAALESVNRWPTWMWANEEIAEMGEWLRTSSASGRDIDFYGLDVYSLWDSMDNVIAYLENTDTAAVARARTAYKCLRHYSPDEFSYGNSTLNENNDCQEEALQIYNELADKKRSAGSDEQYFDALQNALIVSNAERYYYTAVRSNSASWNIRDQHMMSTIKNILEHHGNESKIIIWEHNTHVGDARATDMAAEGMVNVGQLVREQYADQGVYIVGFGSYEGSVVAASSWGSDLQVMNVPAARKGSWEEMLHTIEPADKIVFLDRLKKSEKFNRKIGHRAIGVVYDPRAEQGNYVPSKLPDRYDAFIFIDKTTALKPLEFSEAGRELVRQD